MRDCVLNGILAKVNLEFNLAEMLCPYNEFNKENFVDTLKQRNEKLVEILLVRSQAKCNNDNGFFTRNGTHGSSIFCDKIFSTPI